MSQRSTFDTWKQQLNLVVSDRMGLFVNELPDFDLDTAFAQGLSPEQYFSEVLGPELALLGYAVGHLDSLDGAPASATFLYELSNAQAGLTGAPLEVLEEATNEAAAFLDQLSLHYASIRDPRLSGLLTDTDTAR